MIDLENIWLPENIRFVRRTLFKLQSDHHIPIIDGLIDQKIANTWLVLAYLSKALKVNRYMELGVRRGFSMAVVGGRRKKAHLVGFDDWQPGYGGAANPGPDFVRDELKAIGHAGKVELITGHVANTVPAYEATESFPLILVDADHTKDGTYRDILNVLSFLMPGGGHLVVDDLQDGDVASAYAKVTRELELPSWESGRVGVIYHV